MPDVFDGGDKSMYYLQHEQPCCTDNINSTQGRENTDASVVNSL